MLIDRGEISKRKKKPSKKFRDEFGHTPLSVEEKIPWKCRQLVIGTGVYGKTIELLDEEPKDTNAILHVNLLGGLPPDAAYPCCAKQ